MKEPKMTITATVDWEEGKKVIEINESASEPKDYVIQW